MRVREKSFGVECVRWSDLLESIEWHFKKVDDEEISYFSFAKIV